MFDVCLFSGRGRSEDDMIKGGECDGWFALDGSIYPIELQIECFEPWVSKYDVILSQIGDVEVLQFPFAIDFDPYFCAMREGSGLVVGSVYVEDLSWKFEFCRF